MVHCFRGDDDCRGPGVWSKQLHEILKMQPACDTRERKLLPLQTCPNTFAKCNSSADSQNELGGLRRGATKKQRKPNFDEMT